MDKITEIREKHSTGHYNYSYEVRDAIRFLLDELDKRDECTKENPCRDCLKRSVDGYEEIVRELEDENRKLQKERDKLIEALRWYAETVGSQRARNILREIGVMDV